MQTWVYWFLGDLGFWLQPFSSIIGPLPYYRMGRKGAIQPGCHCMEINEQEGRTWNPSGLERSSQSLASAQLLQVLKE